MCPGGPVTAITSGKGPHVMCGGIYAAGLGLLLLVGPLTAAAAGDAAPDAADAPDGWRPFAVRAEIAPESRVVRIDDGTYALVLAGRGDEAVDGRWQRR